MPHLQLRVTDYDDDATWRWKLSDASGAFVADHEVALDRDAVMARSFFDLPGFLAAYGAVRSPAELLVEAGAWIGEQVFGGVAAALAERLDPPATVVRVIVPKEAASLLRRPLELAHLPVGGGRPVAEAGLRFVYEREGTPAPGGAKPAAGGAGGEKLRVLAVFSLPWGQNPLNLRRERVELERLMGKLSQTRGVSVELRVLHYGATRAALKDALEEGAGWNLIHLSGHGLQGQLVLEDAAGRADRVTAGELRDLLRPARRHLELVTVSSCLSAAGSVALARRQVGLDEPSRESAGEPAADGEEPAVEMLELPSLAQDLAESLDCAVLGMRFQVADSFARESALALYELLLFKEQPLPEALELALAEVLDGKRFLDGGLDEPPPLSRLTPVLFGPRAADLRLVPPAAAGAPSFELRAVGLMYFPKSPERFVGRLRPMLRARQVLAPEGPGRGVLFHGMAGGGKTACALELAYGHRKDRFRAMVWWKAPDEDQDVSGAMLSLATAFETQLPGLELVGLIDDPREFATRVAPQLRDLLGRVAILVVLDNVESLLTRKGGWRDERFGVLVSALLEHGGTSRLVLTSRRVPSALEEGGGVPDEVLLRQAIHALSFPESVLLARELPGLRALFDTPADQELLRRVLAAAQGHPKLLELASGLAAGDRDALVAQLDGEEGEEPAFFAEGETARGPAAFVAELNRWTTALSEHLPPVARLLFQVLCRMEDKDLQSPIVEANWKDILERLRRPTEGEEPRADGVTGKEAAIAEQALGEPGLGLAASLDRLASRGLVEVEDLPVPDGAAPGDQSPARSFRVHPAVAETGRRQADAAAMRATDLELGDFWMAMFYQALRAEMSGMGAMVVEAGRRAAPYLLRSERWEEAATLLEQVIHRDRSPATLAFALPRLREIVRATEGTLEGLENAGLLGMTLLQVGQVDESEQLLRELIERCEKKGEFRQAWANTSNLINLLTATGRLEEALETAHRKAEHTRRAGLGPWTQLSGEAMALRALAAMGRNEEVLERVEELRGKMAELPKERSDKEAVEPWNVQETMLDIGRFAALQLGRWQDALDLNVEILRLRVERGADPVELAGARFNDYFPLLRLGRFSEARQLLESCRQTFEQARAVGNLGKVLSAMADLEDKQQNRREAIGFEEIALRYSYQAGDPEACAISHNNLANYLQRSGSLAERALAHRLAATTLGFQMGVGHLSAWLRNLVNAGLPEAPPTFDELADTVEELPGVKFRQLFDRLPKRAPDGDAALAEVWRLARERQEKRESFVQGLGSLSPEIAAAFQSGDPEKFEAALAAVPPEELQALLEQLQELARGAGMSVPSGPDMSKVLENFAPLLHGIAAVARGNDAQRAEIEEILPQLEEKGWQIAAAVRRIWDGERDAAALTAGLDGNSARLIERVLELLELPSPEELLAALPEAVREAVTSGDGEALQAALAALPPDEAEAVLEKLQAFGDLS